MIFFLNIGRFICAGTSRFGPPPAISSCVGTPGCGEYPLSGSDGYHNDVGTPPLSIASDTRHSSHPRPHQRRTLARSQAPRTQSPVHSSARGIAQLHIKGVVPLSFPQENVSRHPARGIPRDQGNNAPHNDCNGYCDGNAGGRGCSSSHLLGFPVCVVLW